MKHTELIVLVVALVAMPVWVFADADLSAVEPFIDNNTAAVVRVDAGALDIPGACQWIEQSLRAGSKPGQRVSPEVVSSLVQEWLGDFRKAGGTTFYILVNFTPRQDEAVFYVAPLREPSNSAALLRVMAEIPYMKRDNFEQSSTVIGKCVVAGYPLLLSELRTFKPFSRPECLAAMSAGNAPVQLAFIPSDDVKRVFEELAPKLPEWLGGGSTLTLSHSMRSLTFSFSPSPEGRLEIQLSPTDTESAAELPQMVTSIREACDTQARQQNLPWLGDIAKQLDSFSASHPAIVFTPSASQGVVGAAVGSIVQRVYNQLIGDDTTKLLNLVWSCIGYAVHHNQRLPDSLEQMIVEQKLSLSELVNPLHPSLKDGYIYVKTDLPLNKLHEAVIIYDKYDQWNGGAGAGFVDGHSEWVEDEKQLKGLISAATRPTK